MTRLTLALLSGVALAAPAFAADPVMVMPMADNVVVSVSDWTGFYAGVFGGASFNPATPGVLEFDQNLDGIYTPLSGGLAAAFGSNFIGSREGGFTGGFELGYDKQFGKFVVGVVGDLAYVDYTDVQSGFSLTPASYTETTTLNTLGTIRARAGFALGDSILAYVHGGFAAGNVSSTFTSTNPNGVSRGNASQYGYQVGVGLEGMVAEHISLGIEYDYTNLGGRDFTTRFNNGPFAAVNPAGTDVRGQDRIFDFHTIKGSVKYRF